MHSGIYNGFLHFFNICFHIFYFKVTVVTEGDLSEFEGSNQLVVDSKKEKKKLLPEKAKKVKRRLTKKQRKELEKVIERKKKKEKVIYCSL